MISYYNFQNSKIVESDIYKKNSIIIVNNSSEDEIKDLAKKFDLDEQSLDDGLDIKEIPRLEKEIDNKTYIYLKYYDRSKKQLDTILFIITKDFLMILSRFKIDRIGEILQNKELVKNFSNKVHTFLFFAFSSFDDLENAVKLIYKSVRKKIKQETEIQKRDLRVFINYENILNEIISTYAYTKNVYQKIPKNFRLNEEILEEIDDLLIDIEEGLNTSKNTLKTISNLRNLYSISQTNTLNNSIRILTLLTLFINIPAMIFSFYGMNINLPFSNNNLIAYFLLFGVIGFLFFIYLILKRNDLI